MNAVLVRASFALLIGVLALGLSACAKTIDTADLEDQLVEEIAPQFDLDPADVSANCPDDIDAEEGAEVECTMSTSGLADITVDVTLTDDDGGFEAEVPQEQFRQP
jgi:hypothetical protein